MESSESFLSLHDNTVIDSNRTSHLPLMNQAAAQLQGDKDTMRYNFTSIRLEIKTKSEVKWQC